MAGERVKGARSRGSRLARRLAMVWDARVIATYVHNLNPVALPLFNGLAVRWYGLAYLLGFVAGFLLLRHLARRGMWVMKPDAVGDFIAATALFGVFLGGRLGYVLFYYVPKAGWGALAKDPLVIFRVWEGGMASHGGILGLLIFTWIYAKKHRVPWTGLADGLAVVGPVGLFFGRMANFINGELYGRIATGVAWAVKFPATLLDQNAPESQRLDEIASAASAAAKANPNLAYAYQSLESARHALKVAYESGNLDDMAAAHTALVQRIIEANRQSGDVSTAIGQYLDPRHPSQIYEGLLEGLLLFAILWTVRVCFPKAPHGLLTGLFFGLYAVFRIFAEQFREPDAAMVGFLTKGQFFSLFMFLFCAGFLIHAWREYLARERMPLGSGGPRDS